MYLFSSRVLAVAWASILLFICVITSVVASLRVIWPRGRFGMFGRKSSGFTDSVSARSRFRVSRSSMVICFDSLRRMPDFS